MNDIPVHTAQRYLEPLREGGSLPAIVDTDGGRYVVKFRGAGQGARALVAEIVVGSLAEVLGLDTPELAIVDLSPTFGVAEPDPEIQDLLRASHGVNVGLRYLDGAFNFAPAAVRELVRAEFAARVVWLDALVTNPDRTHRNTNLMVQDGRIWLIDHGAALYAHHDWARVDEARTRSRFPLIRNHVLLTASGPVESVDHEMAGVLSEDVLAEALRRVPDALLTDPVGSRDFTSADAARKRYVRYLKERLEPPRAFVLEAAAARKAALADPGSPLSSRR